MAGRRIESQRRSLIILDAAEGTETSRSDTLSRSPLRTRKDLNEKLILISLSQKARLPVLSPSPLRRPKCKQDLEKSRGRISQDASKDSESGERERRDSPFLPKMQKPRSSLSRHVEDQNDVNRDEESASGFDKLGYCWRRVSHLSIASSA